MATQYEVIACINSINNGALVSSLTPAYPTVYLLSTGASVTNNSGQVAAQPVEIGSTGYYRVAYDPAANGDAVLLIDFGGSLTLAGDRYQKVTFRSDPLKQGFIPAVAAGSVNGLALHGDIIKGINCIGVILPQFVIPVGGVPVAGGSPLNGTYIFGIHGVGAGLTSIQAVWMNSTGAGIISLSDSGYWTISNNTKTNGFTATTQGQSPIGLTFTTTFGSPTGTIGSITLSANAVIPVQSVDSSSRTIQAAAAAALGAATTGSETALSVARLVHDNLPATGIFTAEQLVNAPAGGGGGGAGLTNTQANILTGTAIALNVNTTTPASTIAAGAPGGLAIQLAAGNVQTEVTAAATQTSGSVGM